MVVIDNEGVNLGSLQREKAMDIAYDRGLDLVLVSPNSNPPVARIADWAKFKYERSKKLRKNKGKTQELKEWWFKPSIEDRDIQLKLDKVKKFVDKGGLAKLTVKYVNKTLPEAIKATMDKIMVHVTDNLKPTSEVTKEGRNLSIFVKTNKI